MDYFPVRTIYAIIMSMFWPITILIAGLGILLMVVSSVVMAVLICVAVIVSIIRWFCIK